MDQILSCPSDTLISRVRNNFTPMDIVCNRNEVIRDETGVIRSHRDEGRGAVSFTANNQEDRIRSFFGECTQVEGSAFGRYMASFNVTFDRPRFRHTQPRLETDGHREVFRITGYHVQIDGNGSLSECIYQGALTTID